LFAGDGGDSFAGKDDADEVERVGGGDVDDGGTLARAGGAEGFDGFRECELLAAEAGDEASAADFAAGFEAAEDVEEIAPLRGVGFADEEIAEEDAVAGEEHAGGGLEGGIDAAGAGDGGLLGGFGWDGRGVFSEEAPAAGGIAGGALAGGVGECGLAPGGFPYIHDGAELVEAVGCGEAGGGELPEGVLSLLAGEGGEALEVGGEAGSALLQEGANLQGFRAEGGG